MSEGLASADVTVADPAIGTGTFLLGVLRRIAEATEADQGPGAVSGVRVGPAEGGQQLAVEQGLDGLSRGRLVSLEMGFLPRTLDEVPEQRSRTPGCSGRFRFGLARMAFPAHLRDGLQRHRTKRDPPRPPAGVFQQDIGPPAGGPDPDAEADDKAVPDRIFLLARAETGDGTVGDATSLSWMRCTRLRQARKGG